MCYPIGVRLTQCRTLALDTLYQHLFSTPGRDTTTIDQLKHDLVLWLTRHSFEDLPDALEYYLADPNSDLVGDLAHLTFLDPWGVQVHIHPLVTIYINTLLAWTQCFLATYGVYPGLYGLLDTPQRDFLAAQLHLRDTTLPRPLLHRSRGPPTLRTEYVALQPHLAPLPPPDHLYVCCTTCPSFNPSACRATSPSVIPTFPTDCLSTCKSVTLSIHPTVHPSIIPARPSHQQSVHPPSLGPRLISPPPQPSVQRNIRQTVRHCPTICTPSYHVHQAVLHRVTIHPPNPVRPTLRQRLTACTTHPSVCPHVRHKPTV